MVANCIRFLFKAVSNVICISLVCYGQAQPTTRLSLAAHRSFADTVGIYHWGGRQANGVSSGLRAILDFNGKVARIALSPRMAIDYNSGQACLDKFRLAGTLDDEDLRIAIGDSRLKTLIMTVYDGTTFSDCHTHFYLNPGFYSQENTAALVQEYSDFVYRLCELFTGSGKVFILSNWEGDNALYCGRADAYLSSPEFQQQCSLAYEQVYAGNQSIDESIEGMILWLKARYMGVTAGKQRARAAGFTDVDTLVAAEISSVHMLRDAGLKSALYQVLTRASFDYVSYSAYESLGRSNPVEALKNDLDMIQSITGSKNIIVGEIGYSRSVWGEKLLNLIKSITDAALAWGASYVIQWNLYDQDSANNFGLLDLNAQVTELGAYYKQLFAIPE